MDEIASFWVSPDGAFWVRLKDGDTRPASDDDVRHIHDLDAGNQAAAEPSAPSPRSGI